MANQTIHPQGINDVTVPEADSIAISNYGGGIASIYYLVENANRPDAFQLQQTLENSAVVLGPFAVATIVRIEAKNSTVIYDVGASPDTGIGDADTLNGLASDTADTADTIVARDSNGNITTNAFESTVATGTAPITVASTTVVPNLNADLLDGQEGSYYAHEEGVFIPVLIGITSAGTGTYTTQLGNYQKIGNWLRFRIVLVWTAHTGTGNLRITGLPYNGIASSNVYIPVATSSITYTGNQVVGLVASGGNFITLFVETAGSGFASLAMDTAGSLYLTGSYRSA